MKLQEIIDDGIELTPGQQFMYSMIKKTIPHGLKLRRVDDWKKTHRDIEVTDVDKTVAMSGDPLLLVQVNADWERPSYSKINQQLINDDEIGEWTIKKQQDGTFLMLKKKHIKEAVDDRPIIVSMLAKVIAAHFKKQERQVLLHDKEYSYLAHIFGYQWLNNSLKVHIRTPNGNREIIYPANVLSGLRLKSDPDEDAWVLTYDPAKVTDEAEPVV